MLANRYLPSLPELANKVSQKHLPLKPRSLQPNIDYIHKGCANDNRVLGLPNSGDILEKWCLSQVLI